MLSGDIIKTWGPAALGAIITIAVTAWLIRHDGRQRISVALQSTQESIGGLYEAALVQKNESPEAWNRRFISALARCMVTISTADPNLPKKVQSYLSGLTLLLSEDLDEEWHKLDTSDLNSYTKLQGRTIDIIQTSYDNIKAYRSHQRTNLSIDRNQLRERLAENNSTRVPTSSGQGD